MRYTKLLSCFTLIVLSANFVIAARYYVTTIGSDSNNGLSWDTAFADIQTAIDAAARVASDDAPIEVWVASGTYKHTSAMSLKNNVAVYGGFQGDETDKDSRTVGNETIVSGENSYRVFRNTNINNSAILDSITVTEGAYGQGAGIYNSSANPTITNCCFEYNNASNEGGAIYNGGACPVIENCIFTSNVGGKRGGAISNNASSNSTISNCQFSLNSSTERGGAISNVDSSPEITSCSFVQNTSGSGGGLSSNGTSPILTDCLFEGNTVSTDGGAIYDYGSSLRISKCKFVNNTSGNLGGSIFIGYGVFVTPTSAYFTITNCTFQGNSGVKGGGICVSDSLGTLTNCSFNRNTASEIGGGIYNYRTKSLYVNCTITSNTAPQGGGTYNFDGNSPTFVSCTIASNIATSEGGGAYNSTNCSPVFTNCIFWNDRAADAVSEIKNRTGSCIPVVTNCVIEGGYELGTNVITADPLLSAVAYNGGLVPTAAVASESSAIGNGLVSEDVPSSDARNVPRYKPCTIGAFEYRYGISYDKWALDNNLLGDDFPITATPFKDGISNAVKFVFGLSADKSATYKESQLLSFKTGNGILSIEYPVNVEGQDFKVTLMSSCDLITWTEVESEKIGQSGNFYIYGAEKVLSGQQSMFFKIVISTD